MSNDRAAISAGVRTLAEALTDGDVRRIMSVFTKEPVTLPPHEPLRHGRADVKAWHETILGHYRTAAQITPLEIKVSGDIGYVRGAYAMEMTAKDGTGAADMGKILMIWERNPDDTWSLSRNIWNSDAPPVTL
ncbi:MAG: DUF4440 domain-containing protein [Gemmatimonadota bacterium]|nr:DUF4440 domain-containing protein [Gemmatimonadota bacterium]